MGLKEGEETSSSSSDPPPSSTEAEAVSPFLPLPLLHKTSGIDAAEAKGDLFLALLGAMLFEEDAAKLGSDLEWGGGGSIGAASSSSTSSLTATSLVMTAGSLPDRLLFPQPLLLALLLLSSEPPARPQSACKCPPSSPSSSDTWSSWRWFSCCWSPPSCLLCLLLRTEAAFLTRLTPPLTQSTQRRSRRARRTLPGRFW